MFTSHSLKTDRLTSHLYIHFLHTHYKQSHLYIHFLHTHYKQSHLYIHFLHTHFKQSHIYICSLYPVCCMTGPEADDGDPDNDGPPDHRDRHQTTQAQMIQVRHLDMLWAEGRLSAASKLFSMDTAVACGSGKGSGNIYFTTHITSEQKT